MGLALDLLQEGIGQCMWWGLASASGSGMMVQCAGWVGHSLHADPPNRLLAVSSLTCNTLQYGTLPYNAGPHKRLLAIVPGPFVS